MLLHEFCVSNVVSSENETAEAGIGMIINYLDFDLILCGYVVRYRVVTVDNCEQVSVVSSLW